MKNLLTRYMDEVINFGGIATPRHEVYRSLIETAKSTGYPQPQRLADMWMAGYDSRHGEGK